MKAFSVIVQPVVEPMDRFTALILTLIDKTAAAGAGWCGAGVQHDGGGGHAAPLQTVAPQRGTTCSL